MLLNLQIRNYALIDELNLELTPGLNIFTGETGAGKSIVIESLNLILGERASAQLVRKGSSRCFVTGTFDISKLKKLKKFIDDSGLSGDDTDTLILRREIDAAGKSRAFVNDTPAGLNTLLEIGNHLVDVHGQHEHQTLLKTASQRELLDGFAGNEELLSDAERHFRLWKELQAQKDSQNLSEQERARLVDLYSFQVKEINGAKLSPGEEEEIEQALPQMKNAEKLRELSNEAHQLLYGEDGSALEKLNKARKILETINNLSNSLGETAETLNSATYSVEEVSDEMENFAEKLSADPERFNELLSRQDIIHKLKKKYGKDIPEILAYGEKIEKELDALTKFDQNRQELDAKMSKTLKQLSVTCEKLTESRKKAATKLASGIAAELAELGIKKAQFKVLIEKENEPTSEGWDGIEFLFSANPGEDAKPLKNIASGGEMSRVMLGIKTVLAKADNVPVLVFDEIDAGIGGPVGQTVGKKLKALSKHRQILCITHLPQIAAFADKHLSVEKAVQAGKTSTLIRNLAEKDRLEEIARMLSGEEITPSARKHASELLTQSNA
ncbi:MAG: DNA repair protein RecN [Elusimicrobiota bacterium]